MCHTSTPIIVYDLSVERSNDRYGGGRDQGERKGAKIIARALPPAGRAVRSGCALAGARPSAGVRLRTAQESGSGALRRMRARATDASLSTQSSDPRGTRGPPWGPAVFGHVPGEVRALPRRDGRGCDGGQRQPARDLHEDDPGRHRAGRRIQDLPPAHRVQGPVGVQHVQHRRRRRGRLRRRDVQEGRREGTHARREHVVQSDAIGLPDHRQRRAPAGELGRSGLPARRRAQCRQTLTNARATRCKPGR